MSVSDSEVSLSQVDGNATLYDGSTNSLVLAMVQSDVESTVEGKPYTEARARNLHATGTPILRVTGDGNVTGSISLLISSFYGSSAVTPYEVFTFTGGASGWTSTSRGDRQSLKLVLAVNATAAGGASQTITYNYCVFSNVKISPSGGDGLYLLTADFVDHENKPTIA